MQVPLQAPLGSVLPDAEVSADLVEAKPSKHGALFESFLQLKVHAATADGIARAFGVAGQAPFHAAKGNPFLAQVALTETDDVRLGEQIAAIAKAFRGEAATGPVPLDEPALEDVTLVTEPLTEDVPVEDVILAETAAPTPDALLIVAAAARADRAEVPTTHGQSIEFARPAVPASVAAPEAEGSPATVAGIPEEVVEAVADPRRDVAMRETSVGEPDAPRHVTPDDSETSGQQNPAQRDTAGVVAEALSARAGPPQVAAPAAATVGETRPDIPVLSAVATPPVDGVSMPEQAAERSAFRAMPAEPAAPVPAGPGPRAEEAHEHRQPREGREVRDERGTQVSGTTLAESKPSQYAAPVAAAPAFGERPLPDTPASRDVAPGVAVDGALHAAREEHGHSHSNGKRVEAEVRPVIGQVVQAIARTRSDGVVEVRLQPEELGRVRISITPAETGHVVQVLADRPETLDLVRRHIDMLASDLRDRGFGSLDFSFGQERPGQEASMPDAPAPSSPVGARDVSGVVAEVGAARRILHDGHVDMRL